MSRFDRSAFATTNGPIIRTILPARRTEIVTSHSNDVDAALDEQAARFDVPRTHAVGFELSQRWVNASRPLPLTAVYLFERDATHAFVTDRPLDVPGPGHFHATAKRCHAAIFSFEQPLTLAPVTIVKPWGREHWYTGIEARGTSGVTDGRCTSPLSWVLAAAPRRLCGDATLPLLKVLDPAPESVLGDLYFELHDTKQELYVVTRIDRRAWPDGCGAIRFGMNAARRAKYADDQRFRAAYLVAVRKYETVRRTIDGLLDEKRAAAGVQLDVPVPPVLMQRWLDELDPRLIEAERTTRAAMDEFTGMRALREGDIVQLPCGLPHALQHGVRVIEIQTPTFERRIVSFAQKVLTQDRWDTESAVKHMRLDCPTPSEPRAFINEHDCTVERIGEFDRFATRRVRLAPEARLTLPADLPYAVCIGVSGELSLGNARIGPETACLVPGSATQRTLTNIGDADAVCLLSGPNL